MTDTSARVVCTISGSTEPLVAIERKHIIICGFHFFKVEVTDVNQKNKFHGGSEFNLWRWFYAARCWQQQQTVLIFYREEIQLSRTKGTHTDAGLEATGR